MDRLLFPLTLCSALGCGLMGGVFFAFSSFVMTALSRLLPSQGIAAMQAINIAVINGLFLVPFLGTAATCLVLTICSLRAWHRAGAGYLLSGSLLYLVGTFLVTIVFNVPRNDALASVDPTSIQGARLWADYVRGWTAWNHVRAAAGLAGAALLTLALCAANTAAPGVDGPTPR